MKVTIAYVGQGLYLITSRTVSEERIVRIIETDTPLSVEQVLHNKFANQRISSAQELFKLNDEDLLYVHQLPDEWETPTLF